MHAAGGDPELRASWVCWAGGQVHYKTMVEVIEELRTQPRSRLRLGLLFVLRYEKELRDDAGQKLGQLKDLLFKFGCGELPLRGLGRKHGTPLSGWQQPLVSRIGVPDHTLPHPVADAQATCDRSPPGPGQTVCGVWCVVCA